MNPLQPYLFFNGRAEEAINFYQSSLGAEVSMMMRYQDSPEALPPDKLPPGHENKIMHAEIKLLGQQLMLSDGCDTTVKFEGFSLSLTFPTEAEAQKAFAGLSEGGKVEMPLGPTFWTPLFGMVEDRFGVSWMIQIAPPQGS